MSKRYSDDGCECPFCGLSYVPAVPEDRRLHKRMCAQWQEVAKALDLDWRHILHDFESRKSEARHGFDFEGKTSPLPERVAAIERYLQVRYEREIWVSVRYGGYARWRRICPDLGAYIRRDFGRFSHEFDSEAIRAIASKYGRLSTKEEYEARVNGN